MGPRGLLITMEQPKECEKVAISVITATYNAAAHLPGLIGSLRAQTDRDFEWVVADGASNDGTLALVAEAVDLNPRVSSEPDFGVYDAMNRAIVSATGDYYVVIGADDRFAPDAIANFRAAARESGADIVAAAVLAQGRPIPIREGRSWLYGAHAFISSHSVGTLVKRELHQKFGYYSNRFSIIADTLFVKRVCQAGATRHVAAFCAGEYAVDGISNTEVLACLTEGLRVQLLTEKNKYLQIAIFFLRLLKNLHRI